MSYTTDTCKRCDYLLHLLNSNQIALPNMNVVNNNDYNVQPNRVSTTSGQSVIKMFKFWTKFSTNQKIMAIEKLVNHIQTALKPSERTDFNLEISHLMKVHLALNFHTEFKSMFLACVKYTNRQQTLEHRYQKKVVASNPIIKQHLHIMKGLGLEQKKEYIRLNVKDFKSAGANAAAVTSSPSNASSCSTEIASNKDPSRKVLRSNAEY